jgi:hypothetical protein
MSGAVREPRVAHERERRGEGHPLFWLLLGFLCGVMATLGVLLVSSGRGPANGVTVKIPLPVALPQAPAAAPSPKPAVIKRPPNVEIPSRGQAEPRTAAHPPRAAPDPPGRRPSDPTVLRPEHRPCSADQMAEDAAASGMTARSR